MCKLKQFLIQEGLFQTFCNEVRKEIMIGEQPRAVKTPLDIFDRKKRVGLDPSIAASFSWDESRNGTSFWYLTEKKYKAWLQQQQARF